MCTPLLTRDYFRPPPLSLNMMPLAELVGASAGNIASAAVSVVLLVLAGLTATLKVLSILW